VGTEEQRFEACVWQGLVGVATGLAPTSSSAVVHLPSAIIGHLLRHAGPAVADELTAAFSQVVVNQWTAKPSIATAHGRHGVTVTAESDGTAAVRVPVPVADGIDETQLALDVWTPRCSLSGDCVVQVSGTGYMGAARALNMESHVVTISALSGHSIRGWPLIVVQDGDEGFVVEVRWAQRERLAEIGANFVLVPLEPTPRAVAALRARPEWSVLGSLAPWRDVEPFEPPTPSSSPSWPRSVLSDYLDDLLPLESRGLRVSHGVNGEVVVERASGQRTFPDSEAFLEHAARRVGARSRGGAGCDLYRIGYHYIAASSGVDGTHHRWYDLGRVGNAEAKAFARTRAVELGLDGEF